jgi:hypothetical protein
MSRHGQTKLIAPTGWPSGPEIIVDFICERGLLFIVLKNIGRIPATRS